MTVADGLHMRPVTQLVRTAQRFQSTVTLHKAGRAVDAKQPFDLLTLAAECGETLEVETTGPDAEAALAEVCRLFATGFSE